MPNTFKNRLCLKHGALSFVQKAGVRVGDVVIGVNNEDVKWGDHAFVVGLIRKAQTEVTLQLVTPFSLKAIAAHYNLQLANCERLETESGSSLKSNSSSSSGDSMNGAFSTGTTSQASTPRSRQSILLEDANTSALW